ncbi:MAG: diacylglycerol kinase family protein [Kineosporiaceae bacterium]|jgi:diacylglycerol kinase (ATP)
MPPEAPVAVAVNPTSGSGRGARAGARTAELLAAAGFEVSPLQAQNAAELRERVTVALARGIRALIVVGGDGMVNLGVTLVAGTGVPLGIVAAGTGNDNARELGLPVGGDPDDAVLTAIRVLQCGTTRPVDAVRWSTAQDRGWFVGVLGAGFDTIVNERANRWRWLRGHLRYDLAILRELPVFTPRHYTLELDGVARRTSAVLVAVGNGPAYGGGMRICAGAVMDDGLLDVVVAGPMSRRALVRLYPKVYRGTHLEHPAVSVVRARTVRITSPGIVAYADGERLAPLPLTCEVVGGAVHLLAPVAP